MKKLAIAALVASTAMVGCASDYDDGHPHYPRHEREYVDPDRYTNVKTRKADYYFDMMDLNNNDSVSFREHQAFAEISFEEADQDGDGYLSRDEVRAYCQRMMEEWKPAPNKKTYKGRSKAGNPNVKLPNRTNTNPTEHSANPTNPSQENR